MWKWIISNSEKRRLRRREEEEGWDGEKTGSGTKEVKKVNGWRMRWEVSNVRTLVLLCVQSHRMGHQQVWGNGHLETFGIGASSGVHQCLAFNVHVEGSMLRNREKD